MFDVEGLNLPKDSITTIVGDEINSTECKDCEVIILNFKNKIIDERSSDFKAGIIALKDINIDINTVNNYFKIHGEINYKDYIDNIYKLKRIVDYFNKDLVIDDKEEKYYICYNHVTDVYFVDIRTNIKPFAFKNFEDARSVINNPNFKDILDKVFKFDIK